MYVGDRIWNCQWVGLTIEARAWRIMPVITTQAKTAAPVPIVASEPRAEPIPMARNLKTIGCKYLTNWGPPLRTIDAEDAR